MSNNKLIPLSVPVVQGNEWRYVKDCLDTGWVSSVGSYVDRFEQMVAEYVGAKYAVASVNGTAGLHLALLTCGVVPGDEVIVPALTFIAPVNAIRYCQAQPVFMDCDIKTLCLDVEKLAAFLRKESIRGKDGFTYNRKTKRRIKAIIPVHIFGHPVDMEKLLKLAERYGISVVEDATESLGSTYKGKKTGSFGEIGVFSFNGNKIITTGGGGMLVTDNEAFAKTLKHLSTQAKSDPFEYDHDRIGYNYRLTNVLAAIGVAQMEKLDQYVKIKRKNAQLYMELLADVDQVEFLKEQPTVRSNSWFYTLKVPKNMKKPLMEFLLSRNIQVRPIWKLIQTLPMYKKCQSYSISKAVEAYETCLNLPCSVSLREEEIEFVAENVKQFLGEGRQ